MMRTFVASLVFVLGFAFGCSSDEGDDHPDDDGPGSSAECPDDSDLSYDNFGEDFMARYCLDCHSDDLSGSDRNGAPGVHNFDTLDDIRDQIDAIDSVAAASEHRENDLMPPSKASSFPSSDEREQLGEWLACGAP